MRRRQIPYTYREVCWSDSNEIATYQTFRYTFNNQSVCFELIEIYEHQWWTICNDCCVPSIWNASTQSLGKHISKHMENLCKCKHCDKIDLKTLWQQDKFLTVSNFLFSQSVSKVVCCCGVNCVCKWERGEHRNFIVRHDGEGKDVQTFYTENNILNIYLQYSQMTWDLLYRMALITYTCILSWDTLIYCFWKWYRRENDRNNFISPLSVEIYNKERVNLYSVVNPFYYRR